MVILMAPRYWENIVGLQFHPTTFPQAIRSSFILKQMEKYENLDLNLNTIHSVKHILTAGPLREATPPRPGYCLDLQYEILQWQWHWRTSEVATTKYTIVSMKKTGLLNYFEVFAPPLCIFS